VVHMFILADILGGFGINAVAFLSQLFSFGVIFVVLWRWGFPTIIKTLEKRQALIREGVENAERARRELEEATQRAEEVLRGAAEREAKRIQEEAYARAQEIEEQQVARIQQEAARARAELIRLVVNLSINAATKVISKSVDSKDNRRLIEEFVKTSQAKEQ
jgi:F-type H+-transporting ATPase subunit b